LVEPMDHYDVMIVGAGPAGSSTWLHLNKFVPDLAKRTLLIDKAIFPRNKLCAGGVGAWSADVLKQLDIELEIPSLFVSDVEFQYRDESWIYHSPYPFRMAQRADLDMALVNAAKERGMGFKENEAFIEANRGKNGLTVLTSRGKYTVNAIVGADGALSRVRRLTIGPSPSCLASAIQVSAPVDSKYDSEFSQKKLSIDFSPVDDGLQGYTWHFPCLQNGIPFMNHGIVDFRLYREKPKADLKKIFNRVLTVRRVGEKPGSWHSHPIRWFAHDVPMAHPNVFLIGDAAGIEPALGGGIPMALSYGEIAARLLIQAFQNDDFRFRDYSPTLFSHFLGRHIKDFDHLARKLYGGKENPLNQVRDFFTERIIRRQLQSLLLGKSVTINTRRPSPGG